MHKSDRRSTMAMPKSVLSYFTERETRLAVNLLLAKRRPVVPEDVRWEDLPEFYRACLAAEQVEAELAIFLGEVWEEVCRDLPSGWRRSAPYEQAKDCAVDPSTVWDGFCHTREFLRDELGAEICICIGEKEGIQVGYGIWSKGKSLFGKAVPDGWDRADEYCWSPEGQAKIGELIDLSSLREFAEIGRKFILKLAKERQN